MIDYLARVLEWSNLLAAVAVFFRLVSGALVAWGYLVFVGHVLALDSWLDPPPPLPEDVPILVRTPKTHTQ